MGGVGLIFVVSPLYHLRVSISLLISIRTPLFSLLIFIHRVEINLLLQTKFLYRVVRLEGKRMHSHVQRPQDMKSQDHRSSFPSMAVLFPLMIQSWRKYRGKCCDILVCKRMYLGRIVRVHVHERVYVAALLPPPLCRQEADLQ